jgi:hypothetical protein
MSITCLTVPGRCVTNDEDESHHRDEVLTAVLVEELPRYAEALERLGR